jgi:acyl-CoA thioesterase-1
MFQCRGAGTLPRDRPRCSVGESLLHCAAMKLIGRASVLAFLGLWACSSADSGGGSPKADAGQGVDGGGGGDSGNAGDATTHGDAANDTDGGCGGPITGMLTHASPIISRSVPTFTNGANGAVDTVDGAAVVDGHYHNGGWSAGTPSVANPSWVALKLAAGPTRVLVSWDDGGTYDYNAYFETPAAGMNRQVYGFPADYQIATSADSTNGMDGTWTMAVMVTGNSVRTRAHSIDFTGQSWVKMTITAAPTSITTPSGTTVPVTEPNGVQIGEIDVHDLSSSGTCIPDDTWFFMGDSITAFAYDRADIHQPSFAAGINTASPTFFPAMINGGIGGEQSANGLARLPQALSLNPDYRFFVLSFGTNDAANDQTPPATFQSNMQSMITMLKAAGRIPVIPHIPFSGDGMHAGLPQYNAVIDTLVQQNGIMAGPDFYTYFMQNQQLFVCPPCAGGRVTDDLHPDDTGLTNMNALWTTAMRPLYP